MRWTECLIKAREKYTVIIKGRVNGHFLFLLVGGGTRAWHIPGKGSTTELYSQLPE